MSIYNAITKYIITKTDANEAKVIEKRDVVISEGVVAGQDKEVQFNDGGILATNSSFTFDKSNGKLSSIKFSGDGSELTNLPAQVPYVHNHDDRYYTESEIATILLDYYTETEVNNLLAGKQVVLVSGTNIKTINSNSLLGIGNLDISGGAVDSVNSQTGTVILTQDSIGDGTTYKQYSQTEKTKLAGIEASANNYTHPANHAPSIITQDASNRFVTDIEKGIWGGKQDALGFTPENTANKDATGGYVGLTLFKINFKNVLNTITSFFTNSNTVTRTYTFQDRNGTIADDTDLSGKVDKVTDYSLVADTEISKLAGIEAGAEVNNISDINATDLTDGGETALHSHAGAVTTNIFYITKTYTVQGEIKTTDVFPPFEINLATGQTVKVVKWSGAIGSGTSATFKLQKSDGAGGAFGDIANFTGFAVSGGFTNPSASNPADISLADGETVQLVCTAVNTTPTNLMINIVLEYTTTLS